MFKEKIFILIFAVVISVHSFANNSDESNALEITLVPRNNTVVYGNIYWADMYLKNNGNEAVKLCDCNIIGTNYIKEISNPSAKMVEDVYWTNIKPSDAKFITILPGETYNFGATGLDKNYLCNPGNWSYSIRNKFVSVKTPSGGKSWAGVINSNTITINVVGNK